MTCCFQKLRNISLISLFIIIWAVAIASLLAVHYFITKRPKIDKTEVNKFKEITEALTPEERAKIKYYEAGLIKFADGKLAFISDHHSLEEIIAMGLSLKEIGFRIEDPLLLERQMMVREAFWHLNEGEKHLVADRYAVITNGIAQLVMEHFIWVHAGIITVLPIVWLIARIVILDVSVEPPFALFS